MIFSPINTGEIWYKGHLPLINSEFYFFTVYSKIFPEVNFNVEILTYRTCNMLKFILWKIN